MNTIKVQTSQASSQVEFISVVAFHTRRKTSSFGNVSAWMMIIEATLQTSNEICNDNELH